MKVVGYIAAAILVFFGVLFIWGAFGANGNPAWILVGIISVAIGLGIIVLIQRKARQEAATNVTLKIDLPANVAVDAMKCKSCGGALGTDNIKMINGAPVVTCPYCNSIYQLTEEPKW